MQKIDKFHIHEALDRIHVFASSFDDHIATHPAIQDDVNLSSLAGLVSDALGKMYQVAAQRKRKIK